MANSDHAARIEKALNDTRHWHEFLAKAGLEKHAIAELHIRPPESAASIVICRPDPKTGKPVCE